jgi:hypothetical protein
MPIDRSPLHREVDAQIDAVEEQFGDGGATVVQFALVLELARPDGTGAVRTRSSGSPIAVMGLLRAAEHSLLNEGSHIVYNDPAGPSD